MPVPQRVERPALVVGNYYSKLGLNWDNGEENGNYYSILGLNWDNGKENGNYYSILGLNWDNRKVKS